MIAFIQSAQNGQIHGDRNGIWHRVVVAGGRVERGRWRMSHEECGVVFLAFVLWVVKPKHLW